MHTSKYSIPLQVDNTQAFLNALTDALGEQVYTLGGAPRNWAMGLPANDIDVFIPYRKDIDMMQLVYEVAQVTFGSMPVYADFTKHLDSAYAEFIGSDMFEIYQFTIDGTVFEVIVVKVPENTSFLDAIMKRTYVSMNQIVWDGLFMRDELQWISTIGHKKDVANKTLTINNIQDMNNAQYIINNHITKMIEYFPNHAIRIPNFPSMNFFSKIVDENDYKEILNSGMAWEFESNFPDSYSKWLICKEIFSFLQSRDIEYVN